MSAEQDIQNDLTQLNDNIMQAARIAAIGDSETKRIEASKLYDELCEKRTRLQAAVKVPTYKTDKSDIAPDPYARINYLEEKMAEAAASGEMSMYTTMRREKKELIRLHGRRPAVVTSTSAAEIRERRRQQAEQHHANQQRIEDEKANPQERSFMDEGELARKMTEAAERGDHAEYGRLRRERLKLKRA